MNKIQKIVHHQGASNIVGFIFDVCRPLKPVSSRNYALVQLPVTVLSTLNSKLHSIMFSINEGLSVYRSCVLRWWGSEKQIMITVVKKMKCLRWIAIALWQGRVQWNPVNTVTNGPKQFGSNNWVTVFREFLLQGNVWSFLLGGQKQVAVRRGFTVFAF